MKKWFFLLYMLFNNAYAVYVAPPKPKTGIGGMAGHLMEPVSFASDFIYTICLVIGASFLFAFVIKYMEHKRNPLAVSFSTVVFLLIAGLFLVSLPFAYLLIQHGSAYTLFR